MKRTKVGLVLTAFNLHSSRTSFNQKMSHQLLQRVAHCKSRFIKSYKGTKTEQRDKSVKMRHLCDGGSHFSPLLLWLLTLGGGVTTFRASP